MKVKIRITRRFNLMVTITACVAALAMMVKRFNYPVEKLVQGFWIVLLLLAVLLCVAALLGGALYLISSRKNTDVAPKNETKAPKQHE